MSQDSTVAVSSEGEKVQEVLSVLRSISRPDIESAYVLSVSEGSGCGGIENTALLASREPWLLDEFENAVETAGAAAKKAHEEVAALALQKAGPKPGWNSSWKGTRAEFEESQAAWQSRFDEASPPATQFDPRRVLPSIVSELTGSGPLRALPAGWMPPINCRWESDEKLPLSLGVDIDHGCMCMGSCRTAFDADDLRYDMGLSASDPWPPVSESSKWVTPEVTLVFVPGQDCLIVFSGNLSAQQAAERLRAVVSEFEASQEALQKSRALLVEELSSLYTEEQLAQASFEQYSIHSKDKQRRSSIERSLAQKPRLAYALSRAAESQRAAILGI